MKKVLSLIIAILMFGVLSVFSQTPDSERSRFSLGLIGGLNFADLHFPNSQGEDDQRITSLLVYGGGLVLDVRLKNNLLVRMEPMYLQKGGKIEKGSDPVNQPEGQIHSNYIEIPVLVQYAFGKKVQPFIILGSTFGFNLHSEIEFDFTGLQFRGDLTDVTERFDLGITFGGGVQAPLGFGIVFLEGRYTYGLINQRKSGVVEVSSNGFQFDMETDKEDDQFTNRGFQLMLGIAISI